MAAAGKAEPRRFFRTACELQWRDLEFTDPTNEKRRQGNLMRQRTSVNLISWVLFLALGGFASSRAADWPMYRADAARAAYTAEELSADLELRWVYTALHAPRAAWKNLPRMQFDRAYQPVVAGGLLFFGSSVDGRVYALDAATGDERWTLFSGAPIRFAPAWWEGRLFVGSDDGTMYCLSARDGKILWKRRGGPDGQTVLGNEHMVSRWPVRGGPAIKDGLLYFAAGVWPSEGIYIYALKAASGEVVWVNKDSGSISMGQPHGGANAVSGVSSQGHLVVTDDHVFVPTGRAVPAAFRRSDGEFQYYHLQRHGHIGGSTTMATGEFVFNGGRAFTAATGAVQSSIGAGALAGLPDGIVHATRKGTVGYRWVDKERVDRKGEKSTYKGLDEFCRFGKLTADRSVIVAGTRVVAGGDGLVAMVDLESRELLWSRTVEGTVYGLAAAGGRLYASTDRGSIYCFDGEGRAKETPARLQPEVRAAPYGDNRLYAEAAREILEETAVTAGYCLDLGCGDGALAYELARQSKLRIFAVDSDPQQVASARRKIAAAGLYGDRVTVHLRPLGETHYPKYFANLIVSARTVTQGLYATDLDEVARLQRPYGGVVCLGKPGAMRKFVRGALPGAGKWTHQYADPGNTACSADAIRGPLKLLWFREMDQRLVQRHGRGPAPLFLAGTLYSEGLDSLIAVDAYNGRLLWKYPLDGILEAYEGDHLMGTAGTHSNYCVTEQGVYVRYDDRCVRIDRERGVKLGELKAPPTRTGAPGVWGYIASEGGRLYGTLADPEHVVTYRYVKGGDLTRQLTESTTFFCLEAISGELRWQYEAEWSIRHNAIAIGDGRVYLIDRPLALFDRTRGAKSDGQDAGRLVALEAGTGEVVWTSEEDIYGTVLVLNAECEALLMGYQPTAFRLESEVGGRISVFSTVSGRRLWERAANYRSRPVVNGSTVYAQGGAWDLHTGEERPFNFKRSYGCGILAAGANLLVFRSATLGYFDLLENKKTVDFGGLRPGCWINALPVGGLVLVPDGSTGCACSYQNKAWVALEGN